MNKDKILELLADVIEKDIDEMRNLNENIALTEIGLDSIRFIRFIVNMETEFNIEVNDSDLLMQYFETIDAVLKTMGKYFIPPIVLKKVFILDCDNVLWRGISGEEKIYLDESTLLFQQELIRLYEHGILLCLCSKNEQQNIDDAFCMTGMLLKWEHIICAKINLFDKAYNVKKIAEELDLLPESFVFADDSDYELGLVKSLLPEVDTIKVNYSDLSFIDKVKFLFGSVSASDLNRTQLYKEQKIREIEKLKFDTVEEYNNSLGTICSCRQAVVEETERIAELSQRTNQFNLSCRHYNDSEIKQMVASSDYYVLTLSAADKYGDMGIVGAAMVKTNDVDVVVESFMLSCRVFGRGFEFILLDKIRVLADSKKIYGVYVPNDKNHRYEVFYPENGVMLYE